MTGRGVKCRAAPVYRYQDPFGNRRGGTVACPGERGFVGGTSDPTGVTHLGAREYDPSLGVSRAVQVH
ncbi:hypothetical protein GCM10023223_25520 [Stackebrandtia albiflava]